MTENQTFIVGDVLPRIASVSVHQGFHIAVTWEAGFRAGQSDVVDLGPAVMTYKLYAPLRDNPELFRSVHVINYGSALGWGDGEEIDMSAEGVEDLAEQAMTAADFRLFMERRKLTQNAAAAQLGISRRQVNYFLTSKTIPRTVALACAYLDSRSGEEVQTSATDLVSSQVDQTVSNRPARFYALNLAESDMMKSWLRAGFWSHNEFSIVNVDDVASGKVDLATLATNKPVIIKPR